MSRTRGVVLCFHAVSADWPHRLALPPDQLLAQVRVARRVRSDVHVTFDDAYRSIEAVLPELQSLGVRVTIFACSGFADRGGAPLLVPELASDDPADLAGLATMDWDALRGVAARGVGIGSHTVSHPHLPELDDAELERELRESKRRIEQELQRPCPLLAYPYGDHDARAARAARAAGYDAAFALRNRRGDRYALPRVDLYRKDTTLRTALKASPVYRLVSEALE